jgi:hypothetical protein
MLAVRDSVTGAVWVKPTGTHYDLVLIAEAALELDHVPGNDRFVCGCLEDGQFVAAITKAANEQRR